MSGLEPTLLFILPGVLAMMFFRLFGPSGTKKLSDFEVTLYGSALGIPIYLLLFGLFNLHKKTSIHNFTALIERPEDLMIYGISAVFLALIFGTVIAKWMTLPFEWFVNVIRNTDSTKHYGSVWDAFTGDRSEALVRVYPLGSKDNSYVGILKRWSGPDEAENAIMVLRAEEYATLNKYLVYPSRSYLHMATNTVYEYFDYDDVEEAFKEKEREGQS